MRAKLYVKRALEKVLKVFDKKMPESVRVETPKDESFGDVATNVAMVMASEFKKSPREVAHLLKDKLCNFPEIEKVDVAGPGFLNFFFKNSFWQGVLKDILQKRDDYGGSDIGRDKRVLIEYVSANPTGPLHIGHGRGAAVGDSLARVLRFAGFVVDTEYYINDAGRQMKLLGLSIFIRYQQLFGKDIELCEDCYKGDYIFDIAKKIKDIYGDDLLKKTEEEAIEICLNFGKDTILEGIKKDLKEFRVEHKRWVSESKLLRQNRIQKVFDELNKREYLYEKDGALWFKSTAFGDDKDRVLKKSNGDFTYFATDICYHADKFERGYDLLINIWGADHHGYVSRLKSSVKALGKDPEKLKVILIQLVNLLRSGKQIAMSTRAGEFVTLAKLCRDIGVDAARFIFLTRKSDSHLDVDVDLLKKKSMENPVYYVQYAHARICSVFSKAKEKGIEYKQDFDSLDFLNSGDDIGILKKLEEFPETIEVSATTLSPHMISFYLTDLAGKFHYYYNKYPILNAEQRLTQARLILLKGIAQVIKNGLFILGVDAPHKM